MVGSQEPVAVLYSGHRWTSVNMTPGRVGGGAVPLYLEWPPVSRTSYRAEYDQVGTGECQHQIGEMEQPGLESPGTMSWPA